MTFSVADELREHTLASSAIALYNTEGEVFDEQNWSILRTFARDQSPQTRYQILDHEGLTRDGSIIDTTSNEFHGSLAAMLVAHYGTGKPGLQLQEWQLLADWFEKGDGKTVGMAR